MWFQTSKKWDSTLELAVTFEVVNPGNGRYRRPYVAVFIEDPKGKPVRTVELWYQRGRGARWLRDLRNWYRGEVDRMNREGGDLASTMSGPTRQPGVYTVIWDGKNDAGKAVDQGMYSVNLEVAREHGTYQLMRKDMDLTTKPLKVDLPGNTEVKSATFELRKKR
jgi:hypothetical protein